MKHITFHFIHYSYASHASQSHGKKLSPRLRFQTSPVGNTISSRSFNFATTFSPLPSFWSKSMYISSFVFPTSLVWISQYLMVFPGYWNTSSGVRTFLPRHPLPFSNGTGSYPLSTPFGVISRGHPGWFGSANDPENLSSNDDARLCAGEKKSEQQHETRTTAFSDIFFSLINDALTTRFKLFAPLSRRLEFAKRKRLVISEPPFADVHDVNAIFKSKWEKV